MSEKFEQFLLKKPKKKEVPPEKHQEAIRYAQEIQAIRQKEFLTEEDLRRVNELLRKTFSNNF